MGLTFFSLGLHLRLAPGLLKTLSIVVAIAAFLSLIVLGIGDHIHELDDLYRVARIAALVMYLWAVILGIAMYRGHSELTREQ